MVKLTNHTGTARFASFTTAVKNSDTATRMKLNP